MVNVADFLSPHSASVLMPVSAELSAFGDSKLHAVKEACRADGFDFDSLPQSLIECLTRIFISSDYVVDQFQRNTQLHCWALNQPWYLKSFANCAEFSANTVASSTAQKGSISNLFCKCVSHLIGQATPSKRQIDTLEKHSFQPALNELSELEFYQVLRKFRQLVMVRIILRDQNGLASLIDTLSELSQLADTLVNVSLLYFENSLIAQYGSPINKLTDKKISLIVLGMGKLGAYELNLSSDIDLIFAYEEEGSTRGGLESIDNDVYFKKLGQALINSLSKVTADGFVFRVDMRLRPYGQSGPLAMSFSALENYYQKQGRDWERYALIKARAVTGDSHSSRALLKTLQPFIYRRYIDFGVIDALTEMKAMINREVRRKGIENNIKTGAGGIREIEFIAQAFQLVRGGQEPQLQQQSLLGVYISLLNLDLLPEKTVQELLSSYEFLRHLEHSIQAMHDKQTQVLPHSETDQQRISYAMGFTDWHELLVEIDKHRRLVKSHFKDVVSNARQADSMEYVAVDERWIRLWRSHEEPILAAHEPLLTVNQWPSFIHAVGQFRDSKAVNNMQVIARERLDAVMPHLIQCVYNEVSGSVTADIHQSAGEEEQATIKTSISPHPESLLLPVIEAILRRSSYLKLFIQNPVALEQCVRLCTRSVWIAEQLAKQPFLLEELSDVASLYSPPGAEQLRDELRQHLLRIPADDLEWQMEHLRHFKSAHTLRVAAAELQGGLHLMKVSDYLTDIAEVTLEAVLQLAWQQLVEKHGRPMRADGNPCDPDFIIVGYGKLGGREMGYRSDLDLVFIHNADAAQSTDGDVPLESAAFFARLGQRIIHFLSAQTPSGRLYEVDMRLRPSGASGLLVASGVAFEKYQQRQAWTWEHQALVRARVVAGCAQLRDQFEGIRTGVLTRANRLQPKAGDVDVKRLCENVLAMREKMRGYLLEKPRTSLKDNWLADGMHPTFPPEQTAADCFDLKQGVGGMVDIEFMVQYAVLRWSQDYPALARFTDNIRIINALQDAGLWSGEACADLKDAYLSYRSFSHETALQNHSSLVLISPRIRAYRESVIRHWHQVFN